MRKWPRHTDSIAIRSRNNVLLIGRGSNGQHSCNVSLQRPTNPGISVGIPDSNCLVIRSRNDVPSIGRVGDG